MTPADKQEPVAWIDPVWFTGAYVKSTSPVTTYRIKGWSPLYTRPTSDLAERIEGLNLPTIIHGALSRIDVMNYLNMPAGTADDVAEAILTALKEVNSHDRT